MLGIIPIEQLQGNVMVDNWRQEWEKAAQKVLNGQSYGCWSVKADFKLASVSWKKLFRVFLAVAGKYYLFNWLITFQPDGSLSVLSINWERCAEKVDNVCSVSHKNTVSSHGRKTHIRNVATEMSDPEPICQLPFE